jgi:chromosomal replication initiation ATPase DnaA
MTALQQLALPFPHAPDYARADFLEAPSNAEALAWLARTEDWPGGRLAVWGEAGCGKTHLLHRWAAAMGAAVMTGPALRGWPDLPGTGGAAIDDADAAEETALLHLLNAAAEAVSPVLLGSRVPPARWLVRLPDLASRVRSVSAVGIGPPEDDLLRALLTRLLSERRLGVSPPLQAWLLLRLPRTAAAVREAAARLDRAALEAGTGVTRGLIVQVAEDLAPEAPAQPREISSTAEAIASPCAPSLL